MYFWHFPLMAAKQTFRREVEHFICELAQKRTPALNLIICSSGRTAAQTTGGRRFQSGSWRRYGRR